MPVFKHNCPHCGSVGALFTAAAAVAHPNRTGCWTLFMTCPMCTGGIVLVVRDPVGADPMKQAGDLRGLNSQGRSVDIMDIYPAAKDVDVPAHLPEGVAKSFREGCAIVRQSPNAACAMFRRALELGLRELSPDVDAWRLEKRIDKLTELHMLTPAIQSWAHRIRLDGNDAVHGEEDATTDDARGMEDLTRFVLTYLYTLPKAVESAAARAAARTGQLPP